MDDNKMRDEFEAALADFMALPSTTFKGYRSSDEDYAGTPGDKGYALGALEIGWWAWRAAKASGVNGELMKALEHLVHNIKASGKRIDLGLAMEVAQDAIAKAKAKGIEQ